MQVTKKIILWLSCFFSTTQLACPAGVEDEYLGLQAEYFERRVRPLLVQHCYECHSQGASKLQAGLLLDSRAKLLLGGDSGAAVIPGNAEDSLLIQSVRYDAYEMPPKGKLSAEDIQTLVKWVEAGAYWPDEPAAEQAVNRQTFDLQQRAREHWAWQPVQDPSLPAVEKRDWPLEELDQFILAELEQAGLAPARDVDLNALARRIYFDLIGLPPTLEQLEQFLSDSSTLAVERMVDKLLQSPHFGERWGRHWLDLVRYAESRGHEFDDDAENAFQYRDYIVRAFNADVPYDQIIREHIAGDLLDAPRMHPDEKINESILGTGFWFLGEWVHSPVDIRKDETDRFDNMLDVMSKTFLGVTVACARCHDHKFDAISSADYYALSGFLQSSDFRQVRFESLEHNRRIAQQLTELDSRYRLQIQGLVQVCKRNHVVNSATSQSKTREESGERFVATFAGLDGTDKAAQHVIVDYSSIAQDEFIQDGFVFGHQPRYAGELILLRSDDKFKLAVAPRNAAASDPFWKGLESISEGGVKSRSALSRIPRSGRTLRTPTFELQSGDVVCRVHGSGYVVACVDSHRLVAGPLHGATVKKIEAGQNWVRLNLERYVGHRLHLEFTPDDDTQLEVSAVLQAATAEVLQQFEQYEAELQAAVERDWKASQAVMAEDFSSHRRLEELTVLWAEERAALQATIQYKSSLAMAMLDGTGEEDRILIRGSSSNPGAVEPRHFLTAIAGDRPLIIPRGSGRLELAELINDANNPLTSRVIVNRIWHLLLGRGIVPTTDDFGVLGQPPTNPQLLDHLANRFVRDGRSIKSVIRRVVLSRTYRMSSHADRRAIESDPDNLLWHHRPPKRLDAEVIRDALLAISGQLDRTLCGEPVPVHLTEFMEGRGRPAKSGPLDGNSRRSIYVSVRRNFLSPFMLAFDAPTPFSTMGRRNVSNVPAQALIMMNDPFVAEQTKLWAERGLLGRAADASPSEISARIDWFYRTAFSRRATEQELELTRSFLSQQAMVGDERVEPIVMWSDLAHALVNLKEFVFLR